MIVYYAIGGGLGHLTRARRVLSLLDFSDRATIVASQSLDARAAGNVPLIVVPQALETDVDAHRDWIHALLRDHDAERVIVDAFPAGIRGELRGLDMTGIAIDYVARSLRWDEYLRAAGSETPRFETTYVIEPLTPPHDAFVHSASRDVVTLDLRVAADCDRDVDLGAIGDAPFWLIVHAGSQDEVDELIAYTRELQRREVVAERIVVASPRALTLPDDIARVDIHPASALFARATRIVSAAGFNVMLETEPWRTKHHVVPFPRRFDDQFARAARRRVTNDDWNAASREGREAPEGRGEVSPG